MPEAPEEGFLLGASPFQERLARWAPHLSDPSIHHVARVLHLEGLLEASALPVALRALTRRHEALRTAFREAEGRLVQVVRTDLEPDYGVIPPPEGVDGDHDLREAFRAPFDLARPPLVRFRLQAGPGPRHRLLLCAHAAVADCASLHLLARDLVLLLAGRGAELPTLGIQFADHAAWEAEEAASPPGLARLEAALETLADPPPPLDLPGAPPGSARPGLALPFRLEARDWQGLQELAARAHATPFAGLLALVALLLARLTAREDLVLGLRVPGRTVSEVQDVVGPFGNLLPVRLHPAGTEAFMAFLGHARQALVEALARQDLPFERLRDRLPPRLRDLQVLVSLPEEVSLPGWPGIRTRLEPLPGTPPRAPLELTFRRQGGGLEGLLEGGGHVLDPGLARRIPELLGRLCREVVARPEAPLATLPRVTAAEHAQLAAWNGPVRPPPAVGVHALVAAQARRDPGAIAVVQAGRRLTYGELLARADQVARYLARLGLGPGDRVLLATGRRPELVVGMLGVLGAGAAFTILDLDLEPRQQRIVLEASAPRALLAAPATRSRLPVFEGPVALLDLDLPPPSDAPPLPGRPPEGDACLAFPFAEGRRRGVPASHASLVNALHDMDGMVLDGALVTLQATPITFMGALFDLLAPLVHGGRCVLAGPDEAPGPWIRTRIAQEGITTLWLPSALFQELTFRDPLLLEGLHQLVLGPDPPFPAHLERIRTLCLGLRILQGFGLAETGGLALAAPAGPSPRLGRPLANREAWVLDPAGDPVPPGLAGHLALRDAAGRGPLLATGRPVRLREDGLLEPLAVEPAAGSPASARAPHLSNRPVNPLHVQVGDVFEKVLGRPVGVHESFFEAGGTSLAVLQLRMRLEALLGWRPPLDLLFRDPTVAALAEGYLRNRGPEPPVVCLREGASGPPWIFLHGDYFGGGVWTRALAGHLVQPGEAFWAMHPHGTAGLPAPSTVQAMGAEVAERILALPAAGPWRIGGYCNAALVALEAARYLADAGRPAQFLALVAPPLLGPRGPSLSPEPLPEGGDLMHHLDACLLRATAAVRAHVPAPLPMRALLLFPGEPPPGDPSRGWGEVLPGAAVGTLPGNHHTAITRHVAALAAALRRACPVQTPMP